MCNAFVCFSVIRINRMAIQDLYGYISKKLMSL